MDRPCARPPGEVPGDQGAADDREGDGPERGDPGQERGEDQVAAERHQGEADPEPEPAGLGLRDPPGDDPHARPRRRHPGRLAGGRPRIAGPAPGRGPRAPVVDDLAHESRRCVRGLVRRCRCRVRRRPERARVRAGLERGKAALHLIIGGQRRQGGTGHVPSLARPASRRGPRSSDPTAPATTCSGAASGTSPCSDSAARRSPGRVGRPPGRSPGRCSRPGRRPPWQRPSRG